MAAGSFHAETLDIAAEFRERHSEDLSVIVRKSFQLFVAEACNFLKHSFRILLDSIT